MQARKFESLVVMALPVCVQADATPTVGDSSAAWLGFMNWTQTYPAPDPDLNVGSPWGVADLTAVFDDGSSTVTLGPNTIDVPATDAYWYIARRPEQPAWTCNGHMFYRQNPDCSIDLRRKAGDRMVLALSDAVRISIVLVLSAAVLVLAQRCSSPSTSRSSTRCLLTE